MLNEFSRPQDGLAKNEKKRYIKHYQSEVTALQQRLKEAALPVVIVVEGPVLSGKSALVNEIISELDPRFASVFCLDDLSKDCSLRPYFEPFWDAIPENGKITVFEGSWVSRIINDFVKGKLDDAEFEKRIEDANIFERQLINNGYVVIKLFLNVDKDDQSDYLDEIEGNKLLVDSKKLKKQIKNHEDYAEAYNQFLELNKPDSWMLLDGADFLSCRYDAFKYIYTKLKAAVKKGKISGKAYREFFPLLKMPKLAEVDLSPSLPREEYKEELDELSERLFKLQLLTAKKGIPVIIAFEGWDAAGKGSAIRRLAYPLAPRLFKVHPIASPEAHEKNRHHLWRFWQRLPEKGKFAIFDRTWYGRVMVERLEGFCTENDWKRAYAEINEFEKDLTEWGAIVIKFWMQIDKDTQLARFTDRQNTPAKQWKITDEDWRNREKWDDYEVVIDEMIQKTSTEYAPWTIVEAKDKPYARIKVLSTVCDRIEAAVKNKKSK